MKWTERSFCFDFPAGVFPGIVERLRGTPARVASLTRNVPPATLVYRPDGGWSVQEHVGHLNDLNELDMSRLEDYLAGKDVLTAADMTNRKTVEADHNRRSLTELIDAFRGSRNDLVERLEGLTEEQVSRPAMHPRLKRSLRLVDWCYFVAEHDDHHVARMREILRP
jgi:hypothetical protein